MPFSWTCCVTAWVAVAAQGQVTAQVHPCPAPPGLAASDCLGGAVAADAAQVLAGARGRDTAGSRSGALARWVADERAWRFDRWLDSPRPRAGQEFGHALALRDSQLTVGAPADDLRGADAGAAWAILASGERAFEIAVELMPEGSEPGERFGSVVATDGMRAVVSAPAATVAGLPRAGRVMVFEDPFNNPTRSTELQSPEPCADQDFGESIATAGGWVVVGCPGDDASGRNAGCVYVFERSVAFWRLKQRLQAATPAVGARFGQSVSLQGDSIWISEPRTSAGGCVHRFELLDGDFVRASTFVPTPTSAGNEWGWSIATQGNHLIVGAPRSETQGSQSGAAWLAETSDASVRPIACLWPEGAGQFDLMGACVATDEHMIAIGAPGFGASPLFGGAVFAVNLQFDCDSDGLPDTLAIAAGDADRNSNGIPDTCECEGDLDGSGSVDTADISLLLLDFGATDGAAASDLDGTGVVDTADVSLLLLMFGECQ